jgi:hypothetical protein
LITPFGGTLVDFSLAEGRVELTLIAPFAVIAAQNLAARWNRRSVPTTYSALTNNIGAAPTESGVPARNDRNSGLRGS